MTQINKVIGAIKSEGGAIDLSGPGSGGGSVHGAHRVVIDLNGVAIEGEVHDRWRCLLGVQTGQFGRAETAAVDAHLIHASVPVLITKAAASTQPVLGTLHGEGAGSGIGHFPGQYPIDIQAHPVSGGVPYPGYKVPFAVINGGGSGHLGDLIQMIAQEELGLVVLGAQPNPLGPAIITQLDQGGGVIGIARTLNPGGQGEGVATIKIKVPTGRVREIRTIVVKIDCCITDRVPVLNEVVVGRKR